MLGKSTVAGALLVAATATPSFAAQWTLKDASGSTLGSFIIDFEGAHTADATIRGLQGFYTIPSFTNLSTPGIEDGLPTHDFISFFSTETGKTYTTDHGDGSGEIIKINELAITISTLSGPLRPTGGTYDVFIREIFNADETTLYCEQYEELYDPVTGDYIGQGKCIRQGSETRFNTGNTESYFGQLSAISPVPLPPTLALILAGLAALGLGRLRLAFRSFR